MKSMMNSMISSLTIKKKKKMMLQMIPLMMGKISYKKMMINFLNHAGEKITLLALYEFLKPIFTDDELKKLFKELFNDFKVTMPKKMRMMTPVIKEIMPLMMSKMMPMMTLMVTV